MTARYSRTTALRAALLCIRIAQQLSDRDPRRSTAYYRAAWDFFSAWGQA